MYNIINQLLALLDSNVNLKALVTSINPFGVTDINSMYYKVVKLTSNGITGQMRFELTAVCNNYINAINAIAEAEKTLLTLADNQLSNDILTVERNGGGSMRNAEAKTFHETGIFIVTYKERM